MRCLNVKQTHILQKNTCAIAILGIWEKLFKKTLNYNGQNYVNLDFECENNEHVQF